MAGDQRRLIPRTCLSPPLIKGGGGDCTGGKITADKSPKLVSYSHNLPYNHDLVSRARELRKNMTEAEKKLWYGYLQRLKPRFLRQRPIDRFIVDFYCAEHKLVIEVDGEPHFGPEGEGHDAERTAILEGYGLRVLRFSNSVVMESFDWVRETIKKLVEEDKTRNPPYPP